MKHHPIENLAHAVACNSGGMTPEGHAHLLEMARAVVQWHGKLFSGVESSKVFVDGINQLADIYKERIKALEARNAKLTEALKQLIDVCDTERVLRQKLALEGEQHSAVEAAREALRNPRDPHHG